MNRTTHLGDGAYVTVEEDGGLWLTANHHDLDVCTDKVHLDPGALDLLVEFVRAVMAAEG